jgi:hypothetical protein
LDSFRKTESGKDFLGKGRFADFNFADGINAERRIDFRAAGLGMSSTGLTSSVMAFFSSTTTLTLVLSETNNSDFFEIQ